MKLMRILALIVVFTGITFAQVTTEDVSTPFIIVIDTFSLLLLLVTTFFGWELYKMMKGGQLATSWGFITVGIFAFSFGKLIEIGVPAGFWTIPTWFPNTINLVTAIMLALGVFSQRKALS